MPKYKIDREGWPPGPWDGEPDRQHFTTEYGFYGLIVRNTLGNLCGYVAVNNDHPWHGVEYDNIEGGDGGYIDCHGGLTYSADNHKVIGIKGEDGLWWVGFDCAHLGDLVPKMEGLKESDPVMASLKGTMSSETYKDFKYVRKCVELLAQQA